MPVKPISPSEVVEAKEESIPDLVFEAFNELIVKNWDGYKASVEQSEVINLICQKLDTTKSTIFKEKWLDVEDIYRKAGWRVEYDTPGYNESYGAYFLFTKKP